MQVLKLPDLPEFRSFETIGPSGHQRADINGRGAAIECYLDVGSSPVVRWNNFHEELGVYHGELVGKTDVMNRFYELADVNAKFDFSKIETVLDMIIPACVSIRESALLTGIEAEIAASFPNDKDGDF